MDSVTIKNEYSNYIDFINKEILNSKLYNKNQKHIRGLLIELDNAINSQKLEVPLDEYEQKYNPYLTDTKTIINQLEKYLESLKNHSMLHKDMIIEIKFSKKIKFFAYEKSLSFQEINKIKEEIELITNQINKLKNE